MKQAALLLLTALLIGIACGCESTPKMNIPALRQISKAAGLEPDDDEKIVLVLDDVCVGMESRRIFKVLAHVSRSYRDSEGRDYAALETYLNEIFKRYRQIRIKRVVPKIVINGDEAQALETFGTVADPQDPTREPPLNLQGQVTVRLVKINGDWQIVEWGSLL